MGEIAYDLATYPVFASGTERGLVMSRRKPRYLTEFVYSFTIGSYKVLKYVQIYIEPIGWS